jgi:NADH-quinone oxidoreductase subunit C
LTGHDIPLEIEVLIPLAKGDTPSIDSIQMIWKGADWNEKETWDLVGIDFNGHEDMMRVLNPHDSPVGFHPLQKQHRLRYDGHNEMYDDPQGFGRKPVDTGLVK